MKATGKINKRVRRKWYFFFQKKRPCSVLAGLQNLSCSLLFLLLASTSSAPSSPSSFPSDRGGHVKSQPRPALIRYGNAVFPVPSTHLRGSQECRWVSTARHEEDALMLKWKRRGETPRPDVLKLCVIIHNLSRTSSSWLRRSLWFALTAGPAVIFTLSLALNSTIHDVAWLTPASDGTGVLVLI